MKRQKALIKSISQEKRTVNQRGYLYQIICRSAIKMTGKPIWRGICSKKSPFAISIKGLFSASRANLSVLALTSGFRLLLALYAGLLIMLPFPGLCQNAGTGGHALEPSQRAFQGFILPNAYFRHRVFPPLAISGTVWPM